LRWLKCQIRKKYGKFALAQTAAGIFRSCCPIARQVGAKTMYVLDLAFWMFGIRGHTPRDGDFGPDRGEPPFAAGTRTLARALAIVLVSVALLSLALWAAVWLTIKFL
jgi:hypothetical protein